MNGRIAREMRKHVEFDPNKDRAYTEHEVTVRRKILSMSEVEETGKLKADLVWRDVPAFITECVDAKRNLYQFLKRKYVNPDYEMAITRLPNEDDLAELAHKVLKDEEVREDLTKKNTTINNVDSSTEEES